MKKRLIRGLIFAFAGILLLIGTTKIPAANTFIQNYWFIVVAVGVVLFFYSSKFPEVTQQIGYTVGGVMVFLGLVAAPFIDSLITVYPYPAIILAGLLFHFSERIFSLLRLANH